VDTVLELEEGIAIRQIRDGEEADRHREGFISAYMAIFAGFPYFERFHPSDAEAIYDKLLQTPGGIVLVATVDDAVAGFAAAIPLLHKPSVANQLTGLVPVRHTFYLAELGVLPKYRGKKIGRTLVRERIRRIDHNQYSHVVLRISQDNTPSGEMYKALGFTDMGVYMDVRSLRMDGEIRPDRRLFLSRVLSQVHIEE
jgi:ribosomal protein S18 acetylase RimI-like enzyme